MKLFLAVPFSSRVDDNGIVLPDYRKDIEKLLSELRAAGHEVFCALEYTNWVIGKNVAPDEEFKKDLSEIDASDKVVVLLEERVSAGVQLQMGYAHAKGKQLEIYQIGKPAWGNVAFGGAINSPLAPVSDVHDFVVKAAANNK